MLCAGTGAGTVVVIALAVVGIGIVIFGRIVIVVVTAAGLCRSLQGRSSFKDIAKGWREPSDT